LFTDETRNVHLGEAVVRALAAIELFEKVKVFNQALGLASLALE